MPNKINKAKHAVTVEQVSMLKEKLSDPQYMNHAVEWIAKHLASKISNMQ